MFRATLYAFKVHSGLLGSLPAYADQLAIGCLLAVLAPRLPKISGFAALAMIGAVFVIEWFPATSHARTIFMLFILRPLLDASLAGLVLHVTQVPYQLLNWSPDAWLGRSMARTVLLQCLTALGLRPGPADARLRVPLILFD
jgi:hypothetical protein